MFIYEIYLVRMLNYISVYWHISLKKVEKELRFIWVNQAQLKILSEEHIIGRLITLIKQSRNIGRRSISDTPAQPKKGKDF